MQCNELCMTLSHTWVCVALCSILTVGIATSFCGIACYSMFAVTCTARQCCCVTAQSDKHAAGELLFRCLHDNTTCRQQVAAVMLSLEDELSVLDLRYADLLQSVQRLSGCDEEDAEVSFSALPLIDCL